MFSSISRNKEHRDIFILFVIAAIFLCLLSAMFIVAQYNQLSNYLSSRDELLIKSLSLISQDLALDTSKLLVEFSSEYQNTNMALSLLSFDIYNIGLASDDVLFYTMKRQITGICIIVILLSSSLFAAAGFRLRSIYRRISDFTLHIEKIMTGRFDTDLDEDGEGAMAVLAYQFNQMSARMENTLSQLKKEKESLRNMISYISHQFKTPVASLKLFNELIMQGVEDDKRNDFLERSAMELGRLEWLINTLLKIARIEAGMAVIDRKLQDMKETVRSCLSSFEPLYKDKNINIICNFTTEPVLVLHDKEWIGEAFGNIIDNAIKYSKQNSSIEISLWQDKKEVCISVADHGLGIHPDDIDHIFQGFYTQANTSRRRKERSYGIGLALTKLVVERHGGCVSVESKPGEGSKFILTVPGIDPLLTKL